VTVAKPEIMVEHFASRFDMPPPLGGRARSDDRGDQGTLIVGVAWILGGEAISKLFVFSFLALSQK
jgi:hypothetical protein